MLAKPTPRPLAEQREQLDRVIAAKVPRQIVYRTRPKRAPAPDSAQTSRT